MQFFYIGDIILSVIMTTPHEVARQIVQQAQAKRLSLDFSQKGLAERSGVSLGTLKKFERSGKISLESLLKIALVLESLEPFKALFKLPTPESITSLDKLMTNKKRKRGRK